VVAALGVGSERPSDALMVTLLVLVGVAFVLLLVGVAWPLADHARTLAATVRRLAAGDAEVRMPAAVDDDEVGAALEGLASQLSEVGAATRRDRDLMASILDGMEDGVLVLDDQGRIALVNRALRRALLLPAEIVGRTTLEAVRHAELQALLARASASGDEPVSGEIEIAGIKPRRFLVRISRLSGRRPLTLLLFVDVTDLRRLESLRRDFVANVSHELRTPVSAILSSAETLGTGALLDPKAAPMFVDIIERNGQRLQQLIEDLLDLSRIESRELTLSRDQLALAPVIRHGLALLREKADRRQHQLEVHVAADLPPVVADRRALEQVLANLIDNAIKYCQPGATIAVRAEPEGDALVRVVVEDTGPGISEVHLPRLFERFYRIDPGRSRELGGTGLGLSIVKHLVEAMGGRVRVISAVGRGTAFAFTLPRGAGAASPPS
jgi:two-component system phosphate regulon sensor histidine kinase PhoR